MVAMARLYAMITLDEKFDAVKRIPMSLIHALMH